MKCGCCSFWVFLLCTLSFSSFVANGEETKTFTLAMPNVAPKDNEAYLCTGVRMDPTEEYFLISYTPNASMSIAHHMMLSWCVEPGSEEEVWGCGGTSPGTKCKRGESNIMYVWAKDAPKLSMPDGVGYKVGGKTEAQYLVLEVHYAYMEHFRGGETDTSGVIIEYTNTPQPKTAGVVLMNTGGRILPHTIEYMETACTIEENIVLHPFAFRAHTHDLGRVVSGYKIHRVSGEAVWTLIGKIDPQLPQMFYPVDIDLTIAKGDMIAARCTMENNNEEITVVGGTATDEMCNFYVMYWTYRKDPMKLKSCFTPGPPTYYWDMEFVAVPRDASLLSIENIE